MQPCRGLLFIVVVLLLCLPWRFGVAATMNDYFSQMERQIEETIHAITRQEFAEAEQSALVLVQLFARLKEAEMVHIPLDNSGWYYFSTNLYNHANELVRAMRHRNAVEGVHLLATMMHHQGELQATVPYWLRGYLQGQLQQLQHGVVQHNADMVRNAAEILHVSSSRLLMSATARPDAYRHTRWVGSISFINQLGDQIIPLSEQGQWEQITSLSAEISFLLQRWFDSFRAGQDEGA